MFINQHVSLMELDRPYLVFQYQIMTHTYQNPNVVEACTSENRLETLESLSERLDTTQKSLSNYLDTKRTFFPRFFFISDDELLAILGSSDSTSIQVSFVIRLYCIATVTDYDNASS